MRGGENTDAEHFYFDRSFHENGSDHDALPG